MFLFERSRRRVLGLDMTGSSVRLIELSLSRGQYAVEAFAAERVPQDARNENTLPDPEVMRAIIRRVVTRAGTRCRHVALAIDTRSLYTTDRFGYLWTLDLGGIFEKERRVSSRKVSLQGPFSSLGLGRATRMHPGSS